MNTTIALSTTILSLLIFLFGARGQKRFNKTPHRINGQFQHKIKINSYDLESGIKSTEYDYI
jgi:hypothetical protein